MTDTDLAVMQQALSGPSAPDIVAAEAQLRRAQLGADVDALGRLLSDDLLFTGPDGRLGSKQEDLELHGSGAVRFRVHQPRELRVRRIGEDAALSALLAWLEVEVGGVLVKGTYRYTRVWVREGGSWRVAGGHVSAAPDGEQSLDAGA